MTRTVLETILLLKGNGAGDEHIKTQLRRRHGLNELQASEALREYRKEAP